MIVFFVLDPAYGNQQISLDIPTIVYQSFQDFQRNPTEAICFVIGTDFAEKAENLLKSLRSDPNLALIPVFLLRSFGDHIDQLSDGVVGSFQEAEDRARSINTAMAIIDPSSYDDADNVIYVFLGYLSSRQNQLIEPSRNWRHEQFYTYPLAEAFFKNPSDATDWLTSLVDRKLIEPAHIVDRIRLCPRCESAHLNYVDVCPECRSINIQQKPFLHCFSCGHVGPEERFLDKGYLGCPNCLAKLRHIGSDYDRPLENFECNDCSAVFVEPTITVNCMECGATTSPDNLIPRPVYSYHITERGRTSAKTGSLEDVYALLDTLNNVAVIYFESLLDWLLRLCTRHGDESFSLIGIRLVNILDISEQLGRLKATRLIDEFVRRIRDLIRSTDVTTRTSQRNLWILLPKTDAVGCEVVVGRINELLKQTEQESGIKLEFATVNFSAPNEIHQEESARLLMGRLEGALEE